MLGLNRDDGNYCGIIGYLLGVIRASWKRKQKLLLYCIVGCMLGL